MASLSQDDSVPAVGPLVDDGAPYSGLGIVELRTLATSLLPDWDGKLDPVPVQIQSRPYWQYGKGSHASSKRKILGSILLKANSDSGAPVLIRHLVLDGSSQWVIGRNFTKSCNILHMDTNVLQFRLPDQTFDTLSLTEDGDHSYLSFQVFCSNEGHLDGSVVDLVCSYTADSDIRPWSEVKKIIDRVHAHVCGHSSYEDMKLLLAQQHLDI